MFPFEITRLRERLKFSQPQFAEMLGVPVGTLMNWEQARRAPTGSAVVLLQIADRFPETFERLREPRAEVSEPPEGEFFSGEDLVLLAVQNARRIGHALHEQSDQQRCSLDELTADVTTLIQAADSPELHTLATRITRLQELRNVCEYGSFMLMVNRTMEAVWHNSNR